MSSKGVLDLQAFPHILDTMFEYMPWDSFAPLAATCKAIRTRVHAMQAEHLILSQSPDGLELDMVARVGRIIPGFGTIDFTDASKVAEEVARILPVTSLTKTVSVEGFIDANIDLTLIAAAFPNLVNYRITTDAENDGFTPYFPFPCRNVIIFFNSGEGANPRRMDDIDPWDDDFDEDDEPQEIPKGHRQAIPEGVEKIVVNMKGDDIPVADFFPCIFNFPTSVKDFVIVYPRYSTLSDEGSFVNFTPYILIMDTTELIGTDAIYTLVGMDEAPINIDMRAAIRNQFNSYGFKGPLSKEERVEELMSHVRVLTKKEYAQTTDDIELETVEHPDDWIEEMEEFFALVEANDIEGLAEFTMNHIGAW